MADHTCKMAAAGTDPSPHSRPQSFPSNLRRLSQPERGMGTVAPGKGPQPAREQGEGGLGVTVLQKRTLGVALTPQG